MERSNNPFAMVVLTALTYLETKRKKGEVQYKEKRHLARLLLSRNYNKDKIRKILVFIRFHLEIKEQKWNLQFEKEVELLTTQKNITMGIEEQVMEMLKERYREEALVEAREVAREEVREEGREEGREELLFDIVKKLTLKRKTAAEISDLLEVEEALIVSVQRSINPE